MFNKIFKTIIIFFAVIIVLLLWLGLDANVNQTDDPNLVSITYECDKLNQYENVPKEVIEECQTRNKNGN